MMFLVSSLWPFLLVAAALGALVDHWTRRREPMAGDRVRSGILFSLFLLVAVAVFARLVPGRSGLALEIGLVLAVVYYIGAGLGVVVRRMGQA